MSVIQPPSQDNTQESNAPPGESSLANVFQRKVDFYAASMHDKYGWLSRWLPPCIHAPGPGDDGLLAKLDIDHWLTIAMASLSRLSAASSSASETFIG